MNPSNHRSLAPSGLARYGSAPGSFLSSIADSVIGGGGGGGGGFTSAIGSEVLAGRMFSGDSPCLTSESTCRAAAAAASDLGDPYRGADDGSASHALHSFYGSGDLEAETSAAVGDLKGGGPALIRHSSSPAGFFSHLMVDDGGLPVSSGMVNYSQPRTNGIHTMANRGLKSQLSFSRKDTLSKISEVSMEESITCNGSNDFQIGGWDETSSIVFSGPPSKRAKDNNGDISNNLSCIDSQFSLPTTSLEMATVEKYLQTQQDSIAFKVRAKRGCATHPRSIAERERRTKISEKLRKLQELVPNMDKQTSTSDMLDLAVQHIRELQGQVMFLKEDRAGCTCGSNPETP